jgi:hypothetical protein
MGATLGPGREVSQDHLAGRQLLRNWKLTWHCAHTGAQCVWLLQPAEAYLACTAAACCASLCAAFSAAMLSSVYLRCLSDDTASVLPIQSQQGATDNSWIVHFAESRKLCVPGTNEGAKAWRALHTVLTSAHLCTSTTALMVCKPLGARVRSQHTQVPGDGYTAAAACKVLRLRGHEVFGQPCVVQHVEVAAQLQLLCELFATPRRQPVKA